MLAGDLAKLLDYCIIIQAGEAIEAGSALLGAQCSQS